jgi:hypothetical protein
MSAFYAATKEEALTAALELIEKNKSVSWGGSQTLKEIGLIDALKAGSYIIYDKDICPAEELSELQSKVSTCDYYLMSANALTLDGKLINIDGRGDRVARLIYGPKNVIVIVGINKLTTSEEEGIIRARTFAAPLNAIRLNMNTPCVSSGLCHSCLTEGCICTNIVITRMSRIPFRIKVIIVGESLGY